MEDSYHTISSKQIGEGYYTEKRSKFLAFAHHVETVDEAMKVIAEYRRKYYDARHCCYAYMLGSEHNEFRANDDGEPSSTAGKPILGQINSHNLTNILVCVVRYYGGVNLGTGGLIVAYPMMNGVMRIVKDMQPRIVKQSFDNDCTIALAIRKSKVAELKTRLENLAFDM